MAENDLDAGALAEALEGRAVEGLSLDSLDGRLRLGLSGLVLELEEVDAIYLEGVSGAVGYVDIWTRPAKGEGAEDYQFALELLALEEAADPFAGGLAVIHLEPETPGGLHLAARFALASVEEEDEAEDGADDGDADEAAED